MIPFTLERYRIVELYAELLHCSNMSLLNRSAAYAHMYDSEGRLQGGLAGLEELAQVIALNSTNDNDNDNEPMDEEDDQPTPARDFPVRNPSDDSPSLDSDESMTDSEDEPGTSDDEAMEEIAMYDDPQLSPIPVTQTLPSPTMAVASSPESVTPTDIGSSMTLSAPGSSPDSETSGITSRSSGRGSRRSSRSRRRATLEGSTEALLPIGEQLKRRLLDQKVVGTMIVSYHNSFAKSLNLNNSTRTCFSSFRGIISFTVQSTMLYIK